MIWVAGRVLAESELSIDLRDRTFEHGLGLFETMRAINGRVPVLDRHLTRLLCSAGELGLRIDPAQLPDRDAVAALLEAVSNPRDALVRLTLSGGQDPPYCSSLWMQARLLPRVLAPGDCVVAGRFTLAYDDELARHKTLNYWRRRRLKEHAAASGAFEMLGVTPDGCIWEGLFTNLFLVRDGVLSTPCLAGPVLPGIMRGLVLEVAAAAGVPTEETTMTDLEADEIFLTNAVRGVVPVDLCEGRAFKAPGPLTALLDQRVRQALITGGMS